MAPPQILSRSQRRHEQKQTVLVLALVAVVALLSFLAGIMVGRSMAPPPPPVAAAPTPAPRLPVPPPPAAVAAPVEVPPASAPAPTKAPSAASARVDQLSFYDSLAKGEQAPLGSGINLPPPGAIPPPEPMADVVEKPAPVAAPNKTTATTKTSDKGAAPPAVKVDSKAESKAAGSKPVSPASKVEVKTASKPAAKVAAKPTAGSYVIQAASYHKAQEAADLSRKLARKGYTPFVEAVDLGSKGQWHRVYVGPFSNVAAADKVAKRLKSEERLAPVVRKR